MEGVKGLDCGGSFYLGWWLIGFVLLGYVLVSLFPFPCIVVIAVTDINIGIGSIVVHG